MNPPTGTVYVVDDETEIRKALTRLLSAEGFAVCAFASARAFLTCQDVHDHACLVLDVAMPDLDGLALQEHLAKVQPLIPIIFLTGRADVPMSVRAMKAGAADFLTKPVNDTDLLRAVQSALAHVESRRAERSRYLTLTAREREVMAGVVIGKLNKQIAADLGTGEQNIKIHRGRVMEKMQVESLPDLVRVAERLGIGSAA